MPHNQPKTGGIMTYVDDARLGAFTTVLRGCLDSLYTPVEASEATDKVLLLQPC